MLEPEDRLVVPMPVRPPRAENCAGTPRPVGGISDHHGLKPRRHWKPATTDAAPEGLTCSAARLPSLPWPSSWPDPLPRPPQLSLRRRNRPPVPAATNGNSATDTKFSATSGTSRTRTGRMPAVVTQAERSTASSDPHGRQSVKERAPRHPSPNAAPSGRPSGEDWTSTPEYTSPPRHGQGPPCSAITDGEAVSSNASSCAAYAAAVSPRSVYAWDRCTKCRKLVHTALAPSRARRRRVHARDRGPPARPRLSLRTDPTTPYGQPQPPLKGPSYCRCSRARHLGVRVSPRRLSTTRPRGKALATPRGTNRGPRPASDRRGVVRRRHAVRPDARRGRRHGPARHGALPDPR